MLYMFEKSSVQMRKGRTGCSSLELGGRGVPIHDESPGAAEAEELLLGRIVVIHQRHFVEGIGRALHNGLQIEVGVRDVYRQDAMRFEMPEVGPEGFFGNEVNRH